ncbi:phosphoenolpyruvate carboxylase [Capnocytophaga stomatis]|uniref:Phosphoenolpyruvate carboxylase n=1 Tax=Capnocytophaga stomatis TaxID=1848904 RepID=A0A250FT34_9FLAO|nr:phosphoenolpyruvate carboxylase [Capnocytophaga stomatis]ATA88322.1 phosphoenolpyruvate carboxylase [Capnocytophaga stomatis]GIJ93012.1 phosphoenolpyruvate carboxylase [Capnocytophaga stomatis]GIJ96280.1 phosphoenolpyruvate carboxylase [Capnocytophaga stomatis]
MPRKTKLERFNENVLSKYQIYNGILMTLPYKEVLETGTLLPIFSEMCSKGYEENLSPVEIVNNFFRKYLENPTEKEKNDLLFRFIQYIERQVVLFDAIEDASFAVVNNMDGLGTLRNVREKAESQEKTEQLKAYLRYAKVRPVLTAHPTQFYPGAVLGIINDLSEAIKKDDILLIKNLLAQLGKTPFFKKEKPTPYDEAVNLIWYLENIFYHSVGAIYKYIYHNIFKDSKIDNEIIELGFWPGGDRDGNPFVTAEITRKVAERLRRSVIRNYYKDLRNIKRRLTFPEVEPLVNELEIKLYNLSFLQKDDSISLEEFVEKLKNIKQILVEKYQSLFVEKVEDLLHKIQIFGFHFATLDIRQDSRVHHSVVKDIAKTLNGKIFPENYGELSDSEKYECLKNAKGILNSEDFSDELTKQTIESIYAVKEIQKLNGERGANRYIISNNQSSLNVLEVLTMIRLCDWENPTVDVIPLFETINDLSVAERVMQELYTNPTYKEHLKNRNDLQIIMLGFSDGTKDGGYLMANWSIYQAKERLTQVARNNGVKVIFFDGRGGPPARGGGKAHQFYASLGNTIEAEQIQLTIQGQTISSNFGTLESSQYNLEQLLSAGINNKVFNDNKSTVLTEEDKKVISELAQVSYESYTDFKNHPMFIPYLERVSTLKYYAKTNIGSRPSKRSQSEGLNFSDLRAIPFVGSWSQLKQNVPGFYGLGTALKYLEEKGNFDKAIHLYKNSLFFRTLLENSMMSLTKSNFKLTQYMRNDAEFGAFWTLIYEEFELTKKMLLKLTGYSELMENHQSGKASIEIREKMVLPLLTIQQYALQKIKNEISDSELINIYEKMVMRSMFGNINASRNSA